MFGAPASAGDAPGAAPSDKARAEPFRSTPHRLKAALRTRAPKTYEALLKPYFYVHPPHCSLRRARSVPP